MLRVRKYALKPTLKFLKKPRFTITVFWKEDFVNRHFSMQVFTLSFVTSVTLKILFRITLSMRAVSRALLSIFTKSVLFEVIHPDVIYFASRNADDTIAVEIALQYNESYNENLLTFANNIHTTDGGTHEEGFKRALTYVMNDYARKFGKLKDNDKNLSGEDVREGLTAIVSVKLKEAQFEGQTKAKLSNTEVRAMVDRLMRISFLFISKKILLLQR